MGECRLIEREGFRSGNIEQIVDAGLSSEDDGSNLDFFLVDLA